MSRHRIFRMFIPLVMAGICIPPAGFAQTEGKAPQETAVSLRKKKMYKYIYEGVQQDMIENQRAADKYKVLANRIPDRGKTAKQTEEYKKKKEKYSTLAALYAKLVQQDEIILKSFNPGARGINAQAAMELIPALEKDIGELNGGKKPERKWLLASGS